MDKSFKLRITYARLNRTVEEVIQFVVENKHVLRYYIADEVGKQEKLPHIQCWLHLTDEETANNAGALRQQLDRYKKKYQKEEVDPNPRKEAGKTNGIYSLKINREMKPIEYLGYIMKEDDNPITNCDEEFLKEARELDKQYKEKKSKKKKETINQVIDVIEQKIREDMKKDNTIQHNLESYICRKTIEYHRETGRRYVENQAVSIVQTINLRINIGDTNLINRLKDRAFRSPLL